MKRQFLSSTWVILVAVFVFALTGCAGCGGKRAEDVSSLPGVYKGEATLVLPEQLKAMVKADADGKKLIPDGPVPCKLRINEHPNGGVTIEIEEFEMPMQGVNIAPAACQVTQSGKTFTLRRELPPAPRAPEGPRLGPRAPRSSAHGRPFPLSPFAYPFGIG